LLLSGLVLGIGCGDYECKEDESYCDGNVAKTCDYSKENEVSRLKEEDCGRLTCAEVEGPARCATRKGPDPRCEGTEAREAAEPLTFCFEGSIVSCAPSGHATRKERCQAACLENGDGALCTESSEPDPRCGDASEVCDGNLLITCEQGYRTFEAPCVNELTNGEYCIQSGKTAFCAASPEPDPICTADAVCNGASTLSCREGYPLRSRSCDVGTCATTSLGPTCVYGAGPAPACAEIVTGERCDGNVRLSCDSGYAVGRASCWEGTTCHEFATDAACVLVDEPDPNCQETLRIESYCDGDSLVHCEYGYATAREPCGSDKRCFKNEFSNEGQCVDG
jgi:hypothetical protein